MMGQSVHIVFVEHVRELAELLRKVQLLGIGTSDFVDHGGQEDHSEGRGCIDRSSQSNMGSAAWQKGKPRTIGGVPRGNT